MTDWEQELRKVVCPDGCGKGLPIEQVAGYLSHRAINKICTYNPALLEIVKRATVSAMGAQREAILVAFPKCQKAWPAPCYNCAACLTLGIQEMISKVPLAADSQKWLEEHDAELVSSYKLKLIGWYDPTEVTRQLAKARAEAYRRVANHFAHRANLRVNTGKETAYTQVANICEQWATETPCNDDERSDK